MYSPSKAAEKLLLRRAARLWGLQLDYIDAGKKLTKVKEAALIRLLETLSQRHIDSSAALKEIALIPRRRKLTRLLEPVYVCEENRPLTLRVSIPENWNHRQCELVVTLENGDIHPEMVGNFNGLKKIKVDSHVFVVGEFQIPTRLPAGYHRLDLKMDGRVYSSSRLLCRPQKTVSTKKKMWGAFAPLYGVKSPRNWGIGDLRDMAELQNSLHDVGGSFFGTLPLLAAVTEGEDMDPSPYSPVSRLFWNEIYLDVESLSQPYPEIWTQTQTAEFREKTDRLRSLARVDYLAVMALKKPILERLSELFFEHKENESVEYQDFLHRCPLVVSYAEFRSEGRRAALQYHLYVQFKMDQELQRLHRRAKQGEAAGLYLDFPVGVSRSGFDNQVFSSSFLSGVSAGAPPDAMFLGGQNWGFAPLHPVQIREQGYEYFIQCIRNHMRHATILRLDHVMAFLRIYAIPQGFDPKSGGYLRFHANEFFALLAIESARWGVKLVGEDLGTVPASIHQMMEENEALGMWVLPFEADKNLKKSIAKAKPHALACMNTHDMIPFAGYLRGEDNRLFESLGILLPDLSEKWTAERKDLVAAWLKDLGVTSKDELFEKTLTAMAASPAELLLLNVEDLWGEMEPQNVPGTSKEYPNWQRKIGYETSHWFKKFAPLMRRLTDLREEKKKE